MCPSYIYDARFLKVKRQNIKKIKITPTCFGSYVIHHQGVHSCARLKLLVVIHRYFVVCLFGVWQRKFEPVVRYVRLGTTVL